MRTPTKRSYLLCPPTHFAVTYSINPWMDPSRPVDTGLAMTQWQRLRRCSPSSATTSRRSSPVPGLPDMVFAANGATAVNGKVLSARFLHPERAAEAELYRAWFRRRGYEEVRDVVHVNEGEGDYLAAGDRILGGTGFRTDRYAHDEAQELFGLPVISLTLVDPRFYHLDTAMAVLGPNEVMYYPQAFSPGSQNVLRSMYPDAILATAADAEAFGLNAVCDGRNVFLPRGATDLVATLRARGFNPIGVDVSELLKAGGGVKCCTLELR